jgi:hypothetical protein
MLPALAEIVTGDHWPEGALSSLAAGLCHN